MLSLQFQALLKQNVPFRACQADVHCIAYPKQSFVMAEPQLSLKPYNINEDTVDQLPERKELPQIYFRHKGHPPLSAMIPRVTQILFKTFEIAVGIERQQDYRPQIWPKNYKSYEKKGKVPLNSSNKVPRAACLESPRETQLNLSKHSSNSMESRRKQSSLGFCGSMGEQKYSKQQGQFLRGLPSAACAHQGLFSLKAIYRNKTTIPAIQISLNHPSIVKLYAFSANQQYIYLLLEACPGETCTKQGYALAEVPDREHVRIACDAVEYIHDRHIMHRGIESQNVHLKSGAAKLGNFSWAAHTPLMRSTNCGTLFYTPPEMVGILHYSNKVDIWCIGLLTNGLLFGSLSFLIRFMQDFAKITQQEVTFHKVPTVSQEAQYFIYDGLAKEPGDRMNIKQALEHSFLTRKTK